MNIDIGNLIDSLYNLRQQRLEVEKDVKALKAREVALRQEIMTVLDESGLAKASGHVATSGIISSVDPLVTDWDEVHAYIRVNDRFDLLQKRLSAPAWRELNAEGILVPGTEPTVVRDLSLTKSTRG